MSYTALTDAEQAHYDEYAVLRSITDWPGYGDEQDQRKRAARDWLTARRDEIERLAGAQGDGRGWDYGDRRKRFELLAGKALNTALPHPDHRASLPAGGCTDVEKAYIEEREVWWRTTATTDEQRRRKRACTAWLIARRKRLWRLGQRNGWDEAHRKQRYRNLCIATRYGKAFKSFCEECDPATGKRKAAAGSSRQVAMAHMRKRVGYTEQPAGSNSDTRADGIRVAQDRTANGATWLRGQPWCGCWCFYALESANVAGIDSHLASVALIENTAKLGKKCYRGWTTDRSRVQPGDLVIIGGFGVHVEMVRGFDGANTQTFGGNTSPGTAGSQANGGGAYERVRTPGEVRGYALVDYP
jgi:hypothetical protein